MSKLKAVDPKAAEPTKPKIMVFGAAGVGKTWTALDFPNVYYIDTEGGANRAHYTDKLKSSGGSYFGIEQGSQDFSEVIGQVEALATEEHHFKTIVLDSGTKLYDLARQDFAEKKGDAFGADKKEANKPARRLMSWLGRVDMSVIIICHEIPQWGIDAKGERTQIGTTFDCWPKLDYELDLALNIRKQGPQRSARITKSRLIEFPEGDSFSWGYENFAQRYGKEIIEREAKKINLATPEQIEEFKRLLEVVKLDESIRGDKIVINAKENFAEVDQENAAKVINYLKKKIA